MKTNHRPVRGRGRARRAVLALVAGIALLALPALGLAAQSPPTVTTSAPDPTLITDTYALLSGVINPNGTASNYQFQWGTTTDYGQFTPTTNAGNGAAEVPVDASLDALQPNTTYHYRLVVASTDAAHPGTYYGADQTFTTSPSLALKLGTTRSVVKSNHATVTVSCVGPTDDACQGRLTLRTRINGTLRNAGSAPFNVAVGKSKTVSVYLPPAAQKALKTARKHQLNALAKAKLSGVKTPASSRLTLVG
jgi:hypothetical protein